MVMALVVLLNPAEGKATWYWTHGHSGHVEDSVNTPTLSVLAAGLSISQSMNGTYNWVHFAVPTPGDPSYQAQYIKVIFDFTPCINSKISAIHVYDGGMKVKEFTFASSACGSNVLTLDLGSPRSFSQGLGVSAKVDFGVDSGMDMFIFRSVGADFQNTSGGANFYVIPVVPRP